MSSCKQESLLHIPGPSLKRQSSLIESTANCLRYPIPLKQDLINVKRPKLEGKRPEDKVNGLQLEVEASLNEIEQELILCKNSIFVERLKNLLNELFSIENETHERLLRGNGAATKQRDQELAKAESMYRCELEALERSVEEKRALAVEDIKMKSRFAQRVLDSESTIISRSNRKRRAKPWDGEKEETESTTLSDQENYDPSKKIHLQNKVETLQAVYDHQKAMKLNTNNHKEPLDITNEKDILSDLIMIKQLPKIYVQPH